MSIATKPKVSPERTLFSVPDGNEDPLAQEPSGSLDLNPRLLRCFVTVAEELHFGRAADRLYVAQPALSRSIQQLERLLGFPLFIRTTRSVQLTDGAKPLVPAAREVLDSLTLLAGGLRHGHDRIRVAHIPCSDTAALLLDGFAETQPNVTIEEQALSGDEQLRAVRDGELDVALCRAPSDLDGRLISRVVRLDPLLVAQIGRHTSGDKPVDPRLRTVAAADGGPVDADYTDFLRSFEHEVGCSLPRVRVAMGSGTEAYAIRRSGARAFVTLASRGVRLDAAHPVTGTTPLQAYYPWSMVWRRSERSEAVRAFLDTAKIVSANRRWLDTSALPGEPWVPSGNCERTQRWMTAA